MDDFFNELFLHLKSYVADWLENESDIAQSWQDKMYEKHCNDYTKYTPKYCASILNRAVPFYFVGWDICTLDYLNNTNG